MVALSEAKTWTRKRPFTDRLQCMKRKAVFQQLLVQIDGFPLNIEAGENIPSRMRRMEDQHRFLVGDVALHGTGGADLRRGSAGRHHHHRVFGTIGPCADRRMVLAGYPERLSPIRRRRVGSRSSSCVPSAPST